MKYVLAIDQSTQGTKALLFDENLAVAAKAYLTHKQLVDERGYISHDGEEIFSNVIEVVRQVVAKVNPRDIVCAGFCNQRETAAIWDKIGKPLNKFVVWQCGRAAECIRNLQPYAEVVRQKTGLPLSPYFSAAKCKWLLENTKGLPKEFYLGTVDSYLIYRLTGKFVTDVSNACRTQLLNIHTLQWDRELCSLFGVPMSALANIVPNDYDFGTTDFCGVLPDPVPVYASFGDSQAALFAQNCRRAGEVKATYGTGSSVMMNTGKELVTSKNGLVNSVAWQIDGKTNYVLEGNINYTGAIVSWLKDDLRLIESVSELEPLIENANSDDETVFIPAFSGLSAPFWNDRIPAVVYGMRRTTRKEEFVKAAVESVAYQIHAVLCAMQEDTEKPISVLRVDGAPTSNKFLMNLQSGLLGSPVEVSSLNELSAAGAAILAGMKAGIYDKSIFEYLKYVDYVSHAEVEEKYRRWKKIVLIISERLIKRF